ncbi:MAG: putative sulfate exporter family transporter, partial [Bartonella sp.]|nr:putative sulfate exporter family transporter [Bartonella sp.]
AFTALLGVLIILLLPFLHPLLNLSFSQYGVLAGMVVYAVPQVLAATTSVSFVSVQIATLVKLVRVLMLGPIIFTLAIIYPRPEHH